VDSLAYAGTTDTPDNKGSSCQKFAVAQPLTKFGRFGTGLNGASEITGQISGCSEVQQQLGLLSQIDRSSDGEGQLEKSDRFFVRQFGGRLIAGRNCVAASFVSQRVIG